MALLAWIDKLGGTVRLAVSKIASLIFSVVKTPFVLLYRAVSAVFRFFAAGYRRALHGEKLFTGRFARGLHNVFTALLRKPAKAPRLMRYYARRGLRRYGGLALYTLLLLLPVCAGAVLAAFLMRGARLVPALELRAGQEVLGYVADEADYTRARDAAAEILSVGGEASAAALPAVTKTDVKIESSRLTGAQALCAELIGHSGVPHTDACGIYVDGTFLCAVKSEAEARRVFGAYLDELSDGKEGVSGFVEEVRYVQGVYPDTPGLLRDADGLRAMLSPKSADTYYTVTEESTPAQIAAKLGITAEKLLSLNPAAAGLDTLPAGTRLLTERGKPFLTLKTVTTEVLVETKEFETVEIQSDSLYIGSKRVVVEGSSGTQQITNLVTYVDGVRVSSEEISRLTVKEPVAQTVQVGTRALDSSYVIATSYGGILLWPVPRADRINSDYAYRWGKLHAALDIGSSSGTSLGKTVVAAAAGTVVIAGVHSSYGYYVKIDHGNGLQTLYAHCIAGSLMVYPGQKVVAGQAIARVGQTGYATGPHLHFEVIVNGVRVDPKPYLGISRR